MNQAKWTLEHHATAMMISNIDLAEKEIRARHEEVQKVFEKSLAETSRLRTEIQNQCKHTEEFPGFLVAGCDVCGWRDYFDG